MFYFKLKFFIICIYILVDADEILEEIQVIIFEYQICRIIAIHSRHILLRLEEFLKTTIQWI